MQGLSLQKIADITGACLEGKGRESAPFAISTDSRTLRAGELFVALRGKKFDGAAFLEEVFRKGALGAVVPLDCRWKKEGFPLLRHPDPLAALGQLASFWRRQFDIPVVGVTGSTGKSTTKEFLSFLLSRRFKVLSSVRSFNNAIGVPLTLLNLDKPTQVAVLELGTNQKGEIAALSQIAAPTVGLITRIDPAHLAGFGDVASVAEEKGSLFESLPATGLAVVNQDDPLVLKQSLRAKCPRLSFACGKEDAPLKGTLMKAPQPGYYKVSWQWKGAVWTFPHSILGHHNGANLLAAIATAIGLGVSSSDIAALQGPLPNLDQRLNIYRGQGHLLIDDSYNANPASMKAALEFLVDSGASKQTIAILGGMSELGEVSAFLHQEIGKVVAALGINLLIAYQNGGKEIAEAAAPTRVFYAESPHEIKGRLQELLTKPSAILVKGSRCFRMEEVVSVIREWIVA